MEHINQSIAPTPLDVINTVKEFMKKYNGKHTLSAEALLMDNNKWSLTIKIVPTHEHSNEGDKLTLGNLSLDDIGRILETVMDSILPLIIRELSRKLETLTDQKAKIIIIWMNGGYGELLGSAENNKIHITFKLGDFIVDKDKIILSYTPGKISDKFNSTLGLGLYTIIDNNIIKSDIPGAIKSEVEWAKTRSFF